jgi:uncharacterized protein YegL
MRDTQATLSVETAIITFGNGGVKTVQDFVGIDQFTPPTLTAGDLTPMGKAIEFTLDLVEDRKAIYRNNGRNVESVHKTLHTSRREQAFA